MDKATIADLFMRGQDCGQVTIDQFTDRLTVDADTLNKVMACYGGGSGIGETCGAVVGALAVIGLIYGHKGPDDMDARNIMMSKRAEYIEKWKAVRGTCMCRELLGYDVSDPEQFQIILDKGLMFDLCPELVLDSVKILNDMLNEDK